MKGYLSDVFSCFRTDLLEKSSLYGLAVALPFLLCHLPHILQIELRTDEEKDSFFMHVLLHFSHPQVQLFIAVPPFDGVEKHHCCYSFVMRLHNAFEGFLTHLAKMSYYCVPDL